jgi:hypothetical protein
MWHPEWLHDTTGYHLSNRYCAVLDPGLIRMPTPRCLKSTRFNAVYMHGAGTGIHGTVMYIRYLGFLFSLSALQLPLALNGSLGQRLGFPTADALHRRWSLLRAFRSEALRLCCKKTLFSDAHSLFRHLMYLFRLKGCICCGSSICVAVQAPGPSIHLSL